VKFLLIASRVLAVVAMVAFIASFPIRSIYEGRARLAQRIEQNNADSLFGSAGTPLGEPQLYIVDDPKAYLEGRGDLGAARLDENYLKEKGIYPLQLQTVDYFATTFVIFGIASLWLASQLKRRRG
jgi:hypothetical protein